LRDRLVKRKKPWAVAAAAAVLLACTVYYAAASLAWGTVARDLWGQAEQQADSLTSEKQLLLSRHSEANGKFTSTDQIGQHLVGNVEGRLRWLELLKAIDVCLPSESQRPPVRPEAAGAAASTTDKTDSPKDKADQAKLIAARHELHITSLECQHVDDASTWYAAVKSYEQAPADTEAKPGAAAATEPPAPGAPAGPTGPAWIVRLTGYHYHNAGRKDQVGAQFVRTTLVNALRTKAIKLPLGDGTAALEDVSLKDLGITYPVLVRPPALYEVNLPDPNADGAAGSGAPGLAGRPQGGFAPGPAGPTGGMGMGPIGPRGGMMPGMGRGMPPGMGRGMMPGMGRGMPPGMGRGLPPGMPSRPGGAPGGAPATPGAVHLLQFDFDVQFCWQPKTPSERREAKKGPAAAPAG
jgi:type IV pilus assembly protein PilM